MVESRQWEPSGVGFPRQMAEALCIRQRPENFFSKGTEGKCLNLQAIWSLSLLLNSHFA